MNILKRELKVNLKSFLTWTLCVSLLYFLLIIAYPSIIGSIDMTEIYKMFPADLLKAFNLDISDISTAMGWISSEGIIIYILIGSLYSGILGMTILLKEENDKTIDFLLTKPISKNKILTEKILCSFILISLFAIITCLFNLIGLAFINNLDFVKILLLYLAPLMIFYSVFSISLFLSTLMRKTKNSTSICFGLVFGFYIIQVISSISTNANFLKYFTIFTLSDSRYLLTNNMFNPICALITLIIVGMLLFFTYSKYNKKEFLL